jgi:uncharacterized protein YciI
MHYLLFYDYVEDYTAKRAPLRSEHLALIRQSSERGDMVMAGALADPHRGAVLVFRGESPAVAESFAKNDPYVKGGVVTKWEVKPWLTVLGDGAKMPQVQ